MYSNKEDVLKKFKSIANKISPSYGENINIATTPQQTAHHVIYTESLRPPTRIVEDDEDPTPESDSTGPVVVPAPTTTAISEPSIFLFSTASSKKNPPFPVVLHRILCRDEYQGIISWLPHGRSWRVVDQTALEEKVIPKYFRHGRYSSFLRQVNGWGFRRVNQGMDLNSYYHELFLRGLPHLCLKMSRVGKQATPPLSEAVGAPNFYKISEMNPLPDYPEVMKSDLLPASDIHCIDQKLTDQHQDPSETAVDDDRGNESAYCKLQDVQQECQTRRRFVETNKEPPDVSQLPKYNPSNPVKHLGQSIDTLPIIHQPRNQIVHQPINQGIITTPAHPPMSFDMRAPSLPLSGRNNVEKIISDITKLRAELSRNENLAVRLEKIRHSTPHHSFQQSYYPPIRMPPSQPAAPAAMLNPLARLAAASGGENMAEKEEIERLKKALLLSQQHRQILLRRLRQQQEGELIPSGLFQDVDHDLLSSLR